MDHLRERISYDPITGLLTWRNVPWKPALNGKPAGVRHPNGYLYVKLGQKLYTAGRLIWWLMTGEWPPADRFVDHKDGNKQNDAWENLRLATLSENSANSNRKPNSCGYLGVSRHKGGLWRARIRNETKYFKTPEEAARFYDKRAKELYGEFAKLNEV